MSKRISTAVTVLAATFFLAVPSVAVSTSVAANDSNGQTVMAGGLYCC